MIILSLIATVSAQWSLFRRATFKDPAWVIFILYLYYAFFVPILLVVTKTYDIWLVNQPIWVSENDISTTAILNLLGYIGFAIGYKAIARTHQNESAEFIGLSPLRLLRLSAALQLMFIVIISIASLILIAYRNELLQAISSYDSKIETNYDNSVYGYAMSILFLFVSIIANYFILNSNKAYSTGIIAIILFAIASFVVYSKQPFVFSFLAAVCLMSRHGKISAFSFSMMLSVGIVFVLVYLVPIFAVYRATGEISFVGAQANSPAVIASDAIGPYGVTVYALKGYVRPDGHPLWLSLMSWIPRAVWPARPLDFSEDFARQMIMGWRPGFGLAFSPLAEAYVRMGLWGSAFFMALCGAMIGFFQRAAARFMPNDARPAVVLTLASTLTVVALRSPFSAIVTQGIQMAVPVICVGIASSQIQLLRDRFGGRVQQPLSA